VLTLDANGLHQEALNNRANRRDRKRNGPVV